MTTPRQQPPAGQRVPGVEYIGSRAAAAELGVTERTVHRWADDGTLAVAWVTTGGHRRFLPRHVRALKQHLATPPEESTL